MQASHTLKTRFSNFRKVVPLISSGATRNRKENLKWHILMYSIGGWTGEGVNVFPAHAIYIFFKLFPLNFEPPTPKDTQFFLKK